MFKWEKVSSFEVNSIEDWNDVVQFLGANIQEKQVVLLDGPMGAGKTELVKRLVHSFGGRWASSPTFALHNRYQLANEHLPFKEVDHWDLYRLESEDELESSGFYDGFGEDKGLVVVEWASRLEMETLPWNWSVLQVQIQLHGAIRRVDIYSRVKK